MIHRTRLVTLLLALQFVAVGASAQDSIIDLYRKGVAAAGEGDAESYVENIRAALQQRPANPILLRHLAQGLASLGQEDAALAQLSHILDLGASFEFERYDEFKPLQAHPAWAKLLERQHTERAPVGSMELAFTTSEEDLIPEGIAYDPVAEIFYLSSVAQRKIVRVDASGRCEDWFESGEHGYLSGLGLALDLERRRLWAVSDAPADSGLFDETLAGRSALHVFELDSAELIGSMEFEGHSLNDVCVLPDGGAVVTGSVSGALIRISADIQGREEIVSGGALFGANGLCVSEDGEKLYVSHYSIGIQCVDLQTGEITPAELSTSFTTAFVDGLYRDGDRLLAIQNAAGVDRVAVFSLGESGKIQSVETLVARRPEFSDPTTGTFVGGDFYFIADSHVQPFFTREDASVMGGFGPTHVYRVRP